nr:immunoglobulin light chain junction region [Macaca mulatta]MOX28095.1 immunoglobulin light chain junction region [Macaca mulatta]MOX28192.1 immunoglobulin light chain junction region [Macaca mulatta]MOX28198.1 immunoglobulin light chain junction region [Macaca mulatta]MOX28379.1 immunoglobulin light chain junction region [Macaca mulatta]
DYYCQTYDSSLSAWVF